MDLQSVMEKLNSRKLFALLLFIVLEILDKDLAHQVSGMFITYILSQGAVDAATAWKGNE